MHTVRLQPLPPWKSVQILEEVRGSITGWVGLGGTVCPEWRVEEDEDRLCVIVPLSSRDTDLVTSLVFTTRSKSFQFSSQYL